MTTMNISLPETLKAFVDQRVAEGGYSSASEYVRELLREAQQHAARERLEQLLLEGLDSGEPIEVTPEYWANLRARVTKRMGENTGT